MYEEIEIEIDNITYTIEYYIDGDSLTIILPNGETRQTELRGLSINSAIRTRLAGYLRTNKINNIV